MVNNILDSDNSKYRNFIPKGIISDKSELHSMFWFEGRELPIKFVSNVYCINNFVLKVWTIDILSIPILFFMWEWN